MAETLSRLLYYPVVVLLLATLLLRRNIPGGGRKRLAVLLWALILLALWGLCHVFVRYRIRDTFLLLYPAAVAVLVFVFPDDLAPWRIRCSACGARLPVRIIVSRDDNLCGRCAQKE